MRWNSGPHTECADYIRTAPRRPRPCRQGRSRCRPRRTRAPAPASRVRPCTPPRGRGDVGRAAAGRSSGRRALRHVASRRSRGADRKPPRRATPGRTPAGRRPRGERRRRSARCRDRPRERSSRPGGWVASDAHSFVTDCAACRPTLTAVPHGAFHAPYQATTPPCSSSVRRRPESWAHSGPRRGVPTAVGRIPARRRTWMPSGPRRTMESSTGRTIGRLCVNSTSAIGPSRRIASSVAMAIGSSERLPLVQTMGRARAAISRWCSGV